MIYKVFNDESFSAESLKIALSLAKMPTRGLAYIKHILNHSSANTLDAQLMLEDEYQQKAAATSDFKEGVRAFLEKRPAVFTGE